MPRPQQVVDSFETDEGLLELRKRGEKDFMILIDSRVLMTSYITSSELFLSESGCARVAALPQPRVLIGGLGLGFTLRAALDALPRKASVTVAELNPRVIEWCQGPVAEANGKAALDRRVRFFEGDVMDLIRKVGRDPKTPRFDAVLWDLYVGPTRKGGETDPLYGDQSVRQVAQALSLGGTYGIWGETPSPAFEERLKKSGFSPELHRPGGGGLKHAVYLAEKRREPKVDSPVTPSRSPRAGRATPGRVPSSQVAKRKRK